jgi:hypothetical protein
VVDLCGKRERERETRARTRERTARGRVSGASGDREARKGVPSR